MTTKRKIATALLCVSILCSLFSCSKQTPASKNRVFYEYFDTVSTFYDYTGSSDANFSKLTGRVEAELLEYHKLYDIYHEYEGVTNLATINNTAGEGPKKVDEKIIKMLLFAKEMYHFTDGNVNVAFGAVTKIWHDYRLGGTQIPPIELLTEASEHTDITSLIIDEVNMTVELKDSKMRLDVGAIAKGYAVEAISAALAADGYSGYVLDVGGNIRAIGEKPDGTGWTCGVKNPDTSSLQSYVYTTKIKNAAMSTSGSYERFYTVGGVNYHHIINDKTLMPENYYLSVSIKADSSALSDALSTAVFNMKPEEAEAFISNTKGIFAVLVLPNGEVKALGSD